MGLLDNVLGSSFDDPRTAATLQLAQGLLSARRPMEGLTSGLLGYQQSMAQAKQAKAMEEMRAMQMQAQKMQLEAAKQEAARRQGIEAAYRGAIRTPQQMAMGAEGKGPTVSALAASQGMAPGIDQNALIQGLMQADPQAAFQMLQPKQRKVKEFREIRRPDGSVQVVGFDEEGKPIETGMTPYKAAEVRDFGGFVGGIDPITGKVQKFGDKTMSAAERDASARGWAGIRQGDQRLALDREGLAAGGKPPAGYRWSADGKTLEAIPGGPADKPQQATEGERKAATLLKRLEGSSAQLARALGDDPTASKPGVFAEGVRRLGGDSAANMLTSEGRQRVEAAQLDMLDAALTLGTGAAYTREQLEGYRRAYFPQIGDNPKTVKDKEERLKNVIEAARIAAARAAPASSDGWSIKPLGGQ